MPKVAFTPQKNGFHFANYFTNVIKPFPGMRPIEMRGRCGGMAFTALDHFFAGLPIPAYTGDDLPAPGVPPDGSPLADYILQRQVESLLSLSAINVFIWSVLPDTDQFFVRGVTNRCKLVEFPKLKRIIDQGKPAPLVVVVARDLAHLGENHQIVAYGYDYEPANDKITLYVYDNNCPDQEITLTSDKSSPGFKETSRSGMCDTLWRGFFVQDYSPRRPSPNLSALVPARELAPASGVVSARSVAAAARARSRRKALTVTFNRITFHNEDDPAAVDRVALALTVNDQSLRWPKTGARLAANGKSYPIDKSVAVTLAGGDVLTISVDIADERFAQLSAAGEPVGHTQVSYTKADKWGRGSHTMQTSGDAGGYAIDFTVAS